MQKNTGIFIVFIIIVAVILAVALWFYYSASYYVATPAYSPPKTQPQQTSSQTISDGTIAFAYPLQSYALAVTGQPLVPSTYIPACDSGFNYCVYYSGTDYKGTNFESAGLRIQKRPDLITQTTCLVTEPSGFSNLTPQTTIAADYATSDFANISDAAAGHYATGNLYRLFYQGSCYEFETRIGQTQFANYPAGTIQEFTPAEQTALQSQLTGILDGVSLPTGEKNLFAQ